MADTTEPIIRKSKHTQNTMTRTGTVKTGSTIYEGQLVSQDTAGEIINLATNKKCLGVAKTNGAADENIVLEFGHIERFKHAGTSAATDVGKIAYASDNQTAQVSGSNTAKLGPVVDTEEGYLWVWLTLNVT